MKDQEGFFSLIQAITGGLVTRASGAKVNCAKATCADGFSLSIQASSFHYCTPKIDAGPWTAVEIGFPSEADPDLAEYAEDISRPTETVYGWVPAKVVLALLEKHGGLVSGECPDLDVEKEATHD